MDQWCRRIVGFGVHTGSVDGPAACRMFNQVISGKKPPGFLSTDHDPLFKFHRWQANLRIMGIEEIKTVPLTPCSHPYVERLIGTIRREFLDHVLFWNAADLERKLRAFMDYYNAHRVHASLDGMPPEKFGNPGFSRVVTLTDFRWNTHCRGLFHLPAPA